MLITFGLFSCVSQKIAYHVPLIGKSVQEIFCTFLLFCFGGFNLFYTFVEN